MIESKRRKNKEGTTKKSKRIAATPTISTFIGGCERTFVVSSGLLEEHSRHILEYSRSVIDQFLPTMHALLLGTYHVEKQYVQTRGICGQAWHKKVAQDGHRE
jgi:hypothetical protein